MKSLAEYAAENPTTQQEPPPTLKAEPTTIQRTGGSQPADGSADEMKKHRARIEALIGDEAPPIEILFEALMLDGTEWGADMRARLSARYPVTLFETAETELERVKAYRGKVSKRIQRDLAELDKAEKALTAALNSVGGIALAWGDMIGQE